VLWRSGLRVSEALALVPEDLDLVEGTVTILNGKGGRRRVVGLDIGTSLLVDQWLVTRRKLGAGFRSPLFCTLKGGRIDPSYVRHMLPRMARRAGVEKRVHAHGLRHAFAIDLARSGTPLFLIRDSLGHASVATTQTYLSRVGGHEVVEAMRGRNWSMPS
jgi:site-specific recombinase XerD